MHAYDTCIKVQHLANTPNIVNHLPNTPNIINHLPNTPACASIMLTATQMPSWRPISSAADAHKGPAAWPGTLTSVPSLA